MHIHCRTEKQATVLLKFCKEKWGRVGYSCITGLFLFPLTSMAFLIFLWWLKQRLGDLYAHSFEWLGRVVQAECTDKIDNQILARSFCCDKHFVSEFHYNSYFFYAIVSLCDRRNIGYPFSSLCVLKSPLLCLFQGHIFLL